MEIAQSQGFDLKTKLHFKKFKQKNKADYKAHFDLMDETKKRFNEKQEAEKARKTKMVDVKEEKDHAAAIPEDFSFSKLAFSSLSDQILSLPEMKI